MNIELQKRIFWDYASNAIDKLPIETVAQRLVDRWAVIDEALHNGEITKSDMIDILKRIDAYQEVIYCESVREYVIKNLIEKYVKNIASVPY